MRYVLKGKVQKTIERIKKWRDIGGQWIEQKTYFAKREAYFNEFGFAQKTIDCNAEGEPEQSWQFYYNEDGRYQKARTQLHKRGVSSHNIIKLHWSSSMVEECYNPQGKLVQTKRYKLHDYIPSFIEFFAPDGQKTNKFLYLRNPEGFPFSLIHESYQDGKTQLSTTDIEYSSFDEQGNWTEKTELVKSAHGLTTFNYKTEHKRELIYFNR